MSRVFINAKTEMICDTISAALADTGAEITCCFDDEQAAAADLSGYDVVIVSTPLRSEFGLNYVAEIHDRTSAVIIVLAKTEIADEVQNRIKFTGAYVLPEAVHEAGAGADYPNGSDGEGEHAAAGAGALQALEAA